MAKAKKTANQNENSAQNRLEALQEIALELLRERDPHNVLELILKHALNLLICDAGSLYLKRGQDKLMFEVAMNKSIKLSLEKRVLNVEGKSIATFCYSSGSPLRIADVCEIGESAPYQFNSSFDKKIGYRTKSMLVQPLVSSHGEHLGVIQLMNRKNSSKDPWPSDDLDQLSTMPNFNDEDDKLIASFAALASTALENAKLYKEIEDLFEGFVYASVGAIESRDRATRGHSERVAVLTVDLAQKVSRSSDEGINQIHFSEQQIKEVRYAALLHDFGKISVKEQTLMKSEKLLPHQGEAIRRRLDEFNYSKEITELRQLIGELIENGRPPVELDLLQVDRTVRKFRNQMDDYWDAILDINQPTVLDEDKSKFLAALKKLEFIGPRGNLQRLLKPDEVTTLSIKRGSLSPTERREIEEHVTRTFLFLSEIPWTPGLDGVADIAHAHHEKLDGTGYPLGIYDAEIPIQSKIMTICDIFDALVASDRPYKRAVPIDNALDILQAQVKDGKLDSKLFQVFLESEVYKNFEFRALIRSPAEAKKTTKPLKAA